MTELPDVPQGAHQLFGGRLALAEGFVEHLADTGVSHGLIGPREVPRLWDRHVLNCAVMAELIDEDAALIDVGSGAGLPGVALAIARPDVRVTMVEPMVRRTDWLARVIDDLGLTNATVLRGRAPEAASEVNAPVVTARAVARIDKLARWCTPFMTGGHGTLLALKGSSVRDEIDECKDELVALGLAEDEVIACGSELLEVPTLVARLHFDATRRPPEPGARPKRPRSRPRRR